MEILDVATHAVSASGGAMASGFLIRLMLKDWIERQAENGRKADAALLKIAALEAQLQGLDDVKNQNIGQARELAVLTERITNVRTDVNNLGAMVRRCTGEKSA